MKKFICLALSLMMVMSLVTVPVMADEVVNETSSTSTQPLPDMWFTAATVNDSVSTDITDYTVKVGGFGTTWYPAYDEGTEQSGQVRVHNKAAELRTDDEGNPKSWIPTEAWLGKTAVNAAKWEGFRVDATSVSTIANFNKGIGANGAGIVFSTSGTDSKNCFYSDKMLRVDSIRFKMPEATGEETNKAMTVLFGYSNTGYFNTDTIGGSKGTLRLYDGGAYVKDLSAGSDDYYNFLPEGTTVSANKWYRAERVLDTRIDNGATPTINAKGETVMVSNDGSENWQRYIIYDDETNAIIGDSGWVMTGTVSKAATTTADYANKPFNNMGFSAYNYPQGSYVYFDDIKSWAIDVPSSDYEVGDLSNKPKYLEFPIENESGTSRNNWALATSAYDTAYKASGGLNSAIVSQVKAVDKARNNNYIYMQQDFMIPEANEVEIGLLDLSSGAVQNGGNTAGGRVPAGPIKIKDGVLKVYEWDYDTTVSLASLNKYVDAVSLAGETEEWSLTLEPGKWYTAQLKIDQSAYAGKMTFASKPSLKLDDGTSRTMTAADTTKAVVTITDEDGNVYTTEEFEFRSPANYFLWGRWSRVIFVDPYVAGGSLTGSGSTAAVGGFKINIDNQKIVLSNTTIDAADATVFFDEDFEDHEIGEKFIDIMFEQLNPQNETQKEYYKTHLEPSSLAAVTVDKVKCDGVPTSAAITLGEDIDSATVNNTVKLYQGSTEVADMFAGAAYNADTNVLTVNFGALEPMTAYTISIDRAATEIEGNIFSLLPGETGKTAEFNFTTGYSASQPFRFNPAFLIDGEAAPAPEEYEGATLGETLAGSIITSASTLVSYDEAPASYVVIAALYDADGRMEDIMAQTGTVVAGTPEDITFASDTLTITANSTVLRAFVWNTWSLMTPKAGAPYVYPAQ